ncbi:MAG TPA: BON domain-containing protein [Candidatus Limnocylindria bacterium]|nr:BON domain-containing protein [Candidatus Limnocylindria bacterium]
MDQDEDRLPLPSEDSGDLGEPPPAGMTDDPLVAEEEGVPYDPPSERVVEAGERGDTDIAGAEADAGAELEREDDIQLSDGEPARDDELRADVIEALRRSELPAGDRIRVAVSGSRVLLTGEVESIDIAEELIGLAGDVEGVTDVVDELDVAGV